MKISVCIPVFNFDVRELITELKHQIQKDSLNAEIIVIDDASDSKFTQYNRELLDLCDGFVCLEKNIGRSKIRNLFLKYSHADYLLFLDCDGQIISSDFLKKYFVFIELNHSSKVVYGGRIAPQKPLTPNNILRWRFAVERENLPLKKRIEKPYLSFQTNNFLISKNVFEEVLFNTSVKKYGYEDLIFAMDLKAKNIPIHHIENCILNNDLESNEVYLNKVAESIDNLALLLKDKTLHSKLSEIRIVKAYLFISKIPALKFAVTKILNSFEGYFIKNLRSQNPNLTFLDLYKLLLLIKRLS